MLPTKDQQRLKLNSKMVKGWRSYPLKVFGEIVGMIGFMVLPLALLINPVFFVALPVALFARWRILIKAARVYGPYLGNDPGRAHKATDDDVRAAGLF